MNTAAIAAAAASESATKNQASARAIAARPRSIGGAGTNLSGGWIEDLDKNSEVRGSDWYGTPHSIGIGQWMLRDPHVRQSIKYITDPLVGAKWGFTPASSDPIDREIAAFCTWAFMQRLPWFEIVRRMVAGYSTDGFTTQEMTDSTARIPARFENHPGGGIGVVPTGIHDRPANTLYRWHQSAKDPAQLQAIEQWITGADKERPGTRIIPANRIIRITYEQIGANFEGLPILRSAFGPWKIKTQLSVIEAIKHERFALGVPTVVAGENASPEELDAANEAMAEFRANEKHSFVFPFGWQASIWAQSKGDGTDIPETIERLNTDIAINVGAGFTRLGVSGGSGSYALANTLEGPYHLAEEAHEKLFSSAFNIGSDGWSPIRRIVDLNYGPQYEIPLMHARNMPTRNWSEVIKLLVMARQAKLIDSDAPTQDRVRDILEFEPVDESTVKEDESTRTPAQTDSDAGGNGRGLEASDKFTEEFTA